MSAIERSDEELIAAARRAREHAHAPFSGYRVGAAVRAVSGRIHTGCNVEISSFSHTCCAERVAVFKAVSEGEERITAVAVVTGDSPPAPPCGACRQVLHDFGPDMRVVLANLVGERSAVKLSELLPNAFGAERVLRQIGQRHLDG